MAYFRSLHSHLQVLSKEDLKGTRIEHGFKRAFMSLFGHDSDTFTMKDKYFAEYTGIKVKQFRETLLQHMGNVKKSVVERTRHQRQYDRRANKRQMQTQESKVDLGKALDAGLVVMKSRQQDAEQPELNNEGRVDQYTEQCQIKSPMLDSALDNKTTEFSNQFLESENIPKNDDLKVQIQEKVFAIVALKNDLRKLKGNSVDTKFAKPSVLGKPVLQPFKNQLVARQPTTYKPKGPKISKPMFASQVDVKKDLPKPVTQHYLPKGRESTFAKPDHVIASSESRNSPKNMPRFSFNDMLHNHYQEEAKKKTQEKDRNSKSSTSLENTTNGSKPKPRSNNQTSKSFPVSKSSCITSNVVPLVDHSRNSSPFSNSKHFVCSTCHKCVLNANHDACITKFLKEVNLRAKIQSQKTRSSNKSVEQKSHTQKHVRQIFTGNMFSSNKSSVVYEKTSPRSSLRWKPTGRILNTVGLSVQKKQSIDLSAGTSYNVKKENLRVWLLKRMISQKPPRTTTSTEVPTTDMIVMTSMIELESLFVPLFDEYFNGENQVVSKSFVVTTADASDKCQQQPDSTLSTSTLATTVTTDGNFDL
ncbi:hypothetical protein Tco_0488485 [Tanacetum coccineum]